MTWFRNLSLARRFSLLSFILIFSATLSLGIWMGRQIENGVIHRTTDLTALFVDSLVSHHLDAGILNAPSDTQALEVQALLGDSPIGRSLAAYKIWSPDGRIVYSSRPELVGRQFPIEAGLREALGGSVHTEISDLNLPAETYEKQHWGTLIETYAPLSSEADGKIIGAIEFYQPTDALSKEIQAVQIRSWFMLGVSALLIYLVLAQVIAGASRTIEHQQEQLREKVGQLTTLLAQNEQLHDRVSRAAVRVTSLNERFLSRISSDLHDGPGQDLALALLRIDELAAFCESCRVAMRKKGGAGEDFRLIRTALRSALDDMRTTLSGLRLPAIEHLSPGQTAERAIHDFERKTGTHVAYSPGSLPQEAPLSIKITLYRILQEALSNGFRHADGAGQSVRVDSDSEELRVEIADTGDGFDPQALDGNQLGLAGMRERVEILGGFFDMESSPGRGTVIRTRLPLVMPEDHPE